MLYLFDLDGTLISGYMDTPDKIYDDWDILPGRVERLRDLVARGDTVGIVTNQAGVAFDHVTEFAARQKISRAIIDLGLPLAVTPVYVCFAHPSSPYLQYRLPSQIARRKPSGAMIREAVIDWPEAAAYAVLMVGDRPEDEAAAQEAGVSFQWAHIFFGE